MKLAGASALTRIALNPECGWQPIMIRSGLSEPRFYEALTGNPYPREYGERDSARRRGAKFERNAYRNGAAALRAVLSEFVGVPENDIWVRNLEDEEPGGRDVNRIRRWGRTTRILEDHLAGRRVPEILIQPQLRITVSGLGKRPGLFIAPDVMFLDGRCRRYRPLDFKSFVVRGNLVSPTDLERSRLQVAIQSIAFHETLELLGDPRPAEHVGGFVFATPFGLAPHRPQIELLDGSVDRVVKAIDWLARHGITIDAARARDGAPDEIHLLDEVPNHYQERCIASCALADVCRARYETTAQALGDAAAEILGRDADLDRMAALLLGATPADDRERNLAALLRELDAPFATARRVA